MVGLNQPVEVKGFSQEKIVGLATQRVMFGLGKDDARVRGLTLVGEFEVEWAKLHFRELKEILGKASGMCLILSVAEAVGVDKGSERILDQSRRTLIVVTAEDAQKALVVGLTPADKVVETEKIREVVIEWVSQGGRHEMGDLLGFPKGE